MNSKEYTLPNGKKAVFEHDAFGIGKVTLECMDELMSMIADRPQGEWLDTGKDPSHSHPLTAIWYRCSECGYGTNTKTNYCPNCGARMKGADDE